MTDPLFLSISILIIFPTDFSIVNKEKVFSGKKMFLNFL